MCVHDHTHSLSFRLTACRLDLRIAHGLLTAFADAGGRKYLDEVGSLPLPLTDEFTDFLRRPTGIVERLERRQDARTRNESPRNGFAQILVLRRTRTLDRRETGIESSDRIIRCAEHGMRGRLIRAGVTVVIKVVIDMRMRIDKA